LDKLSFWPPKPLISNINPEVEAKVFEPPDPKKEGKKEGIWVLLKRG
jgi:hypothetical protein